MRRTLWMAAGVWVISLFLTASTALASEFFDFQDGTLQGWTAGNPYGTGFGGVLFVGSDSSNFFMQVSDTQPGGGKLAAQAPGSISGDLSIYVGVTWLEFLPVSSSFSTYAILKGVDGTIYISDVTLANPVEVWSPREVSFGSEDWTLYTGTATFGSVLSDVAAFYIDMEVVDGTGLEASVDDILFDLDLSGVHVEEKCLLWSGIKELYAD